MRIERSLAGALALGAAPYLAAQAPGSGVGPAVELPTFNVTDSRILPRPESWRHGQVAGFEILSNASDRATQRLLRDFLEFHRAVGVVWPAAQQASEVPASLILCASGNRFGEFVPVNTPNGMAGSISLSLRDHEQAAIVLDLETTVLPIAVLDGDSAGPGVGNPVGMYADFTLQLHREYVHFLLQNIDPRPPAWLEEGLAQMFMSMTYTDDRITFARVANPNLGSALGAAMGNSDTRGTGRYGDNHGAPAWGVGMSAAAPAVGLPAEDRGFNAALAHEPLLPLEQVFAVTHDSLDARNTLGSLWPKECAALVFLCLYGEHQRYLKPFIEFVDKSAGQPATEELFKECFHFGFKDMLEKIRGYSDFAVFKFYQFRVRKGGKFPDIPPVALRDATEAEVGRIKGDALRLAGRQDASTMNLIAPYVRGSRDPELLAALGIEEHSAGKDDRAAKFLAAAVNARTTRARAYVELAGIRLKESTAKPAGSDGRLSASQVGEVLTPLFAGRTVPPALQETYELIAAAWLKSEVKPSAENLAVVTEGVRLFPRDGDLVYSGALLDAANHQDSAAVSLCNLGIKVAADDSARQRFIDLKSTLTAGNAH